MTRPEQQPPVESPISDALAVDSRERAVRALLRYPPLRRLWSAQFVGGIGDALALLVLVLLTTQAVTAVPTGGGASLLGDGYRGVALAVALVFATRLLATLLFGAVFLGAVSSLTAATGPLDRRWTMMTADGVRLALLLVAPLWIDWTPDHAFACLLTTVFVVGVAERFWTVAKEGAAPALLPAPPAEGASVRPLPDHYEALRRLWARSGFMTLPIAAAGLVAVTLVSNVLAAGVDWFHQHQPALASYVSAGLFAASISVLYFLHLPDTDTPRPRSPLERIRRPKVVGSGPDRGRTGAIPLLVVTCATVAGAIAAAVALAVLHAVDLGGGPVSFGLLVTALTGGTVLGIRWSPRVLPALSRRRLLALATAATGLILLIAGLTAEPTTVLLLLLLAGVSAGVAAHTGHTLLDQETEEYRRPRTTEHLQAVVRCVIALAAVAAPVLAALIGPHRVERGDFVVAHGGAAFSLMLVGALLLPVAALVFGRLDDRQGVPLRHDLRAALRGVEPRRQPTADGFFIVLEGGDGAGKTTQVEVLAEWIRGKGHEVVVTREPGATPIGKRLRSILLDVSSSGLSSRAETLLYAADRAEHVDSVVRPALERGAVVISDRFTDSSIAYQGAGRDICPTEVARISRWATDGLIPHLTVLLDISPETARERFTEAPDRMESEPSAFHQRVRSGFLALAAADPARYLVVDAGQDQGVVSTAIRHRLDQMLPLSDAEITARGEARKAAEEERKRREAEEVAREAEEKRQEEERQRQLARLRAEEEERKERAAEEVRQREAARQAEETRERVEEARRLAEEDRKRRLAEERARHEEDERHRRQLEEEARLRAEAAERRLEKHRRAEEALLLAERARAAEAAENAGRATDEGPPASPDADRAPEGGGDTGPERGANGGGTSSWQAADASETTVELPQPEARSHGRAFDPEETTVTTPVPVPPRADAEETAVLPQQSADPVDRVPPWLFRPEERGLDEVERTREMPQVTPPEQPSGGARVRRDWAEETPLDDLPTLADELLGPYDSDAERRRRGGWRG